MGKSMHSAENHAIKYFEIDIILPQLQLTWPRAPQTLPQSQLIGNDLCFHGKKRPVCI